MLVGMSSSSRGRLAAGLLLAVAILFHLGMLESLRSGRLNPLFDDSTHRKGQAVDFFTVYWGSEQGLEGKSLYQYDLPHGAGPREPPYAYSNFRYFPAWAMSVGWLITRPSPWAAYWMWVAITELLLLAGALWAWRLAGEWGAPGHWRTVVAALWLGFSPYYLELYLGQFTLPLSLMILGLLSLAERDNREALGRAWVLTLFWKFATSLYLPVFHRLRAWRVMLLGAAAVLLFTVPYFLLHPHDAPRFARYFVMGLGAKTHGGNHGAQALASVGMELVWPAGWAIQVRGIPLPLWRVLMLALTATAALLAWRRTLRGRDDLGMMLCLWTAMYFAISRDVWEHHTLMLLPVATWMIARVPHLRIPALIAALLLALPTPFALIDVHGLGPEIDPEPFWNAGTRLFYHAFKALPAMALLWMAYRELDLPEAGSGRDR